MSQRRACKAVGAERTSLRYRGVRPDDGAIRSRLRALGTRAGAILSLTWDRVDFDNGLIHYGMRSERKRAAVVPFGGALRTALERAMKSAVTDRVIEFNGVPVQSIRTGFASACRRAGLANVTPHTLRHAAATWAAMAGADPFQLAAFLGHSRASTTERYAKYHPDYLGSVAHGITRGARKPRANGRNGGGSNVR